MRVLLLGCGSNQGRKFLTKGPTQPHDFSDGELVTLDMEASHNPDVVFNLNDLTSGAQLPFQTGEFEEIHAYEVLEHIGTQGDFAGFFNEFKEYWRVLKPDGLLVGSCPNWDSIWAWGDPGHTRIINAGTLTFLNQRQYEAQIGKTTLSDYRFWWPSPYNLELQLTEKDGESMFFILRKVDHGSGT